MNGLLVVDKPAGPTSHDVVARARRALGERRIGHTGTLDPIATGVLLLVLGRATRLARFLAAAEKAYEATIRLGFSTETCDAEGTPVGEFYQGPFPDRDAVDRALDAFRGTHPQQPPLFSAKKIAGRRSYEIARGRQRGGPGDPREDLATNSASAASNALPAPVAVTAYDIRVVQCVHDTVTVRVHCSAGFYVRALAHDLGGALGTGAHLASLRRTRCAGFGLDLALPLAALEADPSGARSAVLSPAAMLSGLAAVTLTPEGVERVAHGRDVPIAEGVGSTFVRLLDPSGDLVAVGEPAGVPGLLHPAVVLK